MGKVKRMTSVLISIILLVLCSGTSLAAEIPSARVLGWNYTLNQAEATITGTQEEKPVGILTIPDTVDGFPVTAIGSYAFSENNDLYGVIIPEGVTVIGHNAFLDCHELSSVTLPQSIVAIEKNAFAACYKLTEVILPEGLEEIEWSPFRKSGLVDVKIPQSVKSIGYDSGLDYSTNAFMECKSLTTIDVHPQNEQYTSVDGILFDKQQKTLMSYPGAREGAFILPESVTTIGNSAFNKCEGLTSIVFQGNINSIEDSAFAGCKNLTSVTFQGDVGIIGDNAFSGCTNLTSLTIQGDLTSIGNVAFRDCTSLKSISIPASVSNIGKDAFSSSTGGNIDIHLMVTKGSYAEQYAKENGIPFDLSTVTTEHISQGAANDISPMPFDELLVLHQDTYKALVSHPDFKSVLIPTGIYTIGTDIPAGDYRITTSHSVSMLGIDGTWTVYTITPENPMGKLTLVDDDVIEVTNSVTFETYIGLGF